MTVIDDVALVPWLVGDEWKKMQGLECKYVFGHFELPKFFMNAMVQMPDHGEIQLDAFNGYEMGFSGHFHKRQSKGNMHYIGNAFPHNYADAWDDARGMMILDKENDGEPEYINWDNCPKYRTVKLSQLIDKTDEIIKSKMYLRVTLDIPISYEEANFIKETFMKEYDIRELSLITEKDNLEGLIDDNTEVNFESVDQIVAEQIVALDTSTYNTKTLLDIYNGLHV